MHQTLFWMWAVTGLAPLSPSPIPPCVINFQVWSEELFKLAMNILAQNASRNTFLRKA